MSTIPETMKLISRNIQYSFEELIKLLIRKTLRPALNPLNPNTNIVYNNYRGRYERGFIRSSIDDNINKYSYIMTHESLGWTEETLVNFKTMAKFIKNNLPMRFPAGNALIYNVIKPKSKVAFTSHGTGDATFTPYKKFISVLVSNNINNIIANKQASSTYTTDVPYSSAFKELEMIGQDIIDQTDPCICSSDSAAMSTSMLRAKLHNLELSLAELSVNHPTIYDAYIEMLRIMNSFPRNKIVWVINLVAALTYQRWDCLPVNKQNAYLDALGEEFISIFIDNELITILLQSDTSELILSCSYLYPLLKMLFIAFGYSKLVPCVTDFKTNNDMNKNNFNKHLEKYQGAFSRRGRNKEIVCEENTNIFPDYQWTENLIDDNGQEIQVVNRNIAIPPNDYHSDFDDSIVEPVDQCIYNYIKLFGDLYPTLIELMGGIEEFPPETIKIACDDIPPTYECLSSLPQYLWRYNDYSYCRYLEHISSKQLGNALNAKINSKLKYLYSI